MLKEPVVSDREQILQQALALSPEDRAYVAVALENSLVAVEPPVAAAAAELLTELQRRSGAYRAGEAQAKPAGQVLAELSMRQAGENRH
jgi:hypothetical protein